jgi:hypothetical protein
MYRGFYPCKNNEATDGSFRVLGAVTGLKPLKILKEKNRSVKEVSLRNGWG